MESKYILGIDTSNYTTSVALVDLSGNIVIDARRILDVKRGERGLRQSDALFQHLENLPRMLEETIAPHKDEIKTVAVSDRPRNVEGSYMPVFKAGTNFGQVVAASLGVPIYRFSHQEGHLAAGLYCLDWNRSGPFIAFHLSGGTMEILKVDGQRGIEIVGETKDISYGQLIDRIGVKLGLKFPAGAEMDIVATEVLKLEGPREPLKKISVKNLDVNLSGFETHMLRLCEKNDEKNVIFQLFNEIADSLDSLTNRAILQYNIKKVLFIGGVSSSEFIRLKLADKGVRFADTKLAADNAVGTALLGGRIHGAKTDSGFTGQ